jgi:porin
MISASKYILKLLTIFALLMFGSLTYAQQPEGGDLWMRSQLLSRSPKLAKKGITIDFDVLQTFQGVMSGGVDEEWKWGGSADLFITFDFGKMGLWPGGFLKLFAETQFGENVIGDTGALTVVNTDALFPLPNEHETTLTSVVFTQFLSNWFAVFLGKIDTLDGDGNAFAGGRGKNQFMNQNLVLNTVTLRTVPSTALGGGFFFLLPDMSRTLTLLVQDANGEPNTLGHNAFDDGQVYSFELKLPFKPFGLSGHHLFGGTYSTRDFMLLDPEPRLSMLKDLLTGEPITLRRKPDSWCFYYNFDQYLYVEHEDKPQGDSPQGVGVFGRFGLADDDTNPVEWLFNIGIGGKGIIPGRDRDTFGLGYYYLGLSDELPGRILPDDGQGVEIWYNIEATPWLHITPDLQVINSSRKGMPTTLVGGIRVKLDF